MTTEQTPQVEAVVDPATGHIVTADRQWAWVNDTWVPAASVGVSPEVPVLNEPVHDPAVEAYAAQTSSQSASQSEAAQAADPYAAQTTTDPYGAGAQQTAQHPQHVEAAPAQSQSQSQPQAPETFVLGTSQPASSGTSSGSGGFGSRMPSFGGGSFKAPSFSGGQIDPGFLGLIVPLTLMAVLGGLFIAACFTGLYLWSKADVLLGSLLGGVSFNDNPLLDDPTGAIAQAEAVIRNAKILGTVLALGFSSLAAFLAFKLGKINAAILGGPAVGLVTVTFGWLVTSIIGNGIAIVFIMTILISATITGWCLKVGRE